jgi:hypothetical protein
LFYCQLCAAQEVLSVGEMYSFIEKQGRRKEWLYWIWSPKPRPVEQSNASAYHPIIRKLYRVKFSN